MLANQCINTVTAWTLESEAWAHLLGLWAKARCAYFPQMRWDAEPNSNSILAAVRMGMAPTGSYI